MPRTGRRPGHGAGHAARPVRRRRDSGPAGALPGPATAARRPRPGAAGSAAAPGAAAGLAGRG
ncbi:MAG: hypothetical protein EPO12_17130 [Aquabacterium sp.]|nr:MAG: hypothetical protein EPO12_17130 [Aquabacterium sp.]